MWNVKRLVGAALVALAVSPVAVALRPPPGLLTIEQALQAIEVDARAIRDGDEPLAAMQQQAQEIEAYVAMLPALTPGEPQWIVDVETRLRELAAKLDEQVSSQDNFATTEAANDLLDELRRLREYLGPEFAPGP